MNGNAWENAEASKGRPMTFSSDSSLTTKTTRRACVFFRAVENNKIQKKLETWNTREAKKAKHQIGIFRFLSRNAELNRCPWVESTRATWFRSSPRTSGTEGTIKVSYIQLNIGWTFSFSALCDIFDKVDLSGNGTISIAEYVSMCQVCNLFSA